MVEVRDENDNSPQCPPSNRLDIPLAINSSTGVSVLRVEASDNDYSEQFRVLSYSVKGSDSSYFTINTTSGVLTLARTLPDRSTALNFIVEVGDGEFVTSCNVDVELFYFSNTVTIILCNTTVDQFALSITTLENSLSEKTGLDIQVATYTSIDTS